MLHREGKGIEVDRKALTSSVLSIVGAHSEWQVQTRGAFYLISS